MKKEKTLGELLRQKREEGNRSQREIAKQTGLSNSTVSRLEADAGEDPAFSTILKIADAVGYDRTDLLSDAGYLKETGQQKYVRHAMDHMTDEQQDNVLTTVTDITKTK